MKIVGYIFFSLSILMTLIHLLSCFFVKEKLRKFTKVFCVSSLALSIAFYSPKSYLIYGGALFGALGDYFLIENKKPKRLLLGIISFFIGHILYASQMIVWMNLPKYVVLLIAIIEILLIAVLEWVLHPRQELIYKEAAGPGIAYFVLLGSMGVLSIASAIVTKNVFPAIMMIIGYIIFISSDTILTFTSYQINLKRDNFYIMLTYLLAQYLITIGLVFTSLPL